MRRLFLRWLPRGSTAAAQEVQPIRAASRGTGPPVVFDDRIRAEAWASRTRDSFAFALTRVIIPLLQEYFFDDWNRLAAVLGEREKGGNFLAYETIEDPMGEGGAPLKSWRVRPTFDEEAYGRLLSAKPAPADDAGGEQSSNDASHGSRMG